MSGAFQASWLDLREPADRRARNAGIRAAVIARVRERPPGRVIDIGCGTGATYRALQPDLPDSLGWTLIDRDAELLKEAARRTGPDAECRRMDLADLSALEVPEGALVTCSALLDLVGAAWLVDLTERLARSGGAFYAALDVCDGPRLSPTDATDSLVFAAFREHQGGDKGFGPALGPGASAKAARLMRAAGFRVRIGASDWRLGGDDRELLLALVDGWAAAASESDPEHAARFGAWREKRRRQASTGALRATVPHCDLLAEPGS